MAGTLFGIGSPTLPAQSVPWGLGSFGTQQPLQGVPIQLQQPQALQHYQLQQIQQLLQVLPQQIQQLQQWIQVVPQQVAQIVHQLLLQTAGQSPLQSSVLGMPYQMIPSPPGT